MPNDWVTVTSLIGDAFVKILGANEQYGNIILGLLVLAFFATVFIWFQLPFEIAAGATLGVMWFLVSMGWLPWWSGFFPFLVAFGVLAFVILRVVRR